MADTANRGTPAPEGKPPKGSKAPKPGLRLLEEIGRIISEARGVRSEVQRIVEAIAAQLSKFLRIFDAERSICDGEGDKARTSSLQYCLLGPALASSQYELNNRTMLILVLIFIQHHSFIKNIEVIPRAVPSVNGKEI